MSGSLPPSTARAPARFPVPPFHHPIRCATATISRIKSCFPVVHPGPLAPPVPTRLAAPLRDVGDSVEPASPTQHRLPGRRCRDYGLGRAIVFLLRARGHLPPRHDDFSYWAVSFPAPLAPQPPRFLEAILLCPRTCRTRRNLALAVAVLWELTGSAASWSRDSKHRGGPLLLPCTRCTRRTPAPAVAVLLECSRSGAAPTVIQPPAVEGEPVVMGEKASVRGGSIDASQKDLPPTSRGSSAASASARAPSRTRRTRTRASPQRTRALAAPSTLRRPTTTMSHCPSPRCRRPRVRATARRRTPSPLRATGMAGSGVPQRGRLAHQGRRRAPSRTRRTCTRAAQAHAPALIAQRQARQAERLGGRPAWDGMTPDRRRRLSAKLSLTEEALHGATLRATQREAQLRGAALRVEQNALVERAGERAGALEVALAQAREEGRLLERVAGEYAALVRTLERRRGAGSGSLSLTEDALRGATLLATQREAQLRGAALRVEHADALVDQAGERVGALASTPRSSATLVEPPPTPGPAPPPKSPHYARKATTPIRRAARRRKRVPLLPQPARVRQRCEPPPTTARTPPSHPTRASPLSRSRPPTAGALNALPRI
ncbi:hypothetical protein B0H10DRAFT_2215070 [Mycena sp. CBHHK59/15]|nr:hypothetical protein B0H10DRAFT_2215070 [Mycena sp. CBHHK59/15]